MDEDLAGVFSAIDDGAGNGPVQESVTETPVAEGAEAPVAPETKTEKTETKKAPTEEASGTPETPVAPVAPEAGMPEPSKTETQTETLVEDNWKETLPPRPADYAGPQPEVDPETGQVTNMDLDQYQTWQRENMMASFRQEMWDNQVQQTALDNAEKILPDMKTNPGVRKMVLDTVTASILSGQQIDSYEAARQVREAMGIGPAQIAAARAEATANVKTHIEVQKIAGVETSTPKAHGETDKVQNLQKRIRGGDDEAFAELLDIWTDAGVIN